jgi:hypothetical protein
LTTTRPHPQPSTTRTAIFAIRAATAAFACQHDRNETTILAPTLRSLAAAHTALAEVRS